MPIKIESAVKGHMVKRFTRLEERLRLSTAAARLSERSLGVVVTPTKENPIAVVTLRDIELAREHGHAALTRRVIRGFPRALTAGSGTPMDLVLRNIARAPAAPVRDVVVLGEQGIVGVVPVERAVSLMQNYAGYRHLLQVSARAPQIAAAASNSRVIRWDPQAVLAGTINLPGGPNCFPFICATCEFENCLVNYPIKGREPRCQNRKVERHKLNIAYSP
jgi:hypothetical protein